MSSRVKHISTSNITKQSPVGSLYQRLIELLTQNNGNLNSQNYLGETMLILATLDGNLSTAKLLVESGADINLSDANGFTPLMYGILKNREEVVQYLLHCGANVELKNKYGKDSLDLKLDQLTRKSIIDNIIMSIAGTNKLH